MSDNGIGKLPWRITNDTYAGFRQIEDAEGQAMVTSEDGIFWMPDGCPEYIVKAVNNHEALLAQVQNMVAIFGPRCGNLFSQRKSVDDGQALIERITKAEETSS